MQLAADCGVVVVYLTIISLAHAAASELRGGQFGEFAVDVDSVTDYRGLHVTGRGSVSTRPDRVRPDRTKPGRSNGTLGRLGAAARDRDQPRTDIREPTAYRHDSTHCLNGGTGFLQTFCFCKAEFTGRYCEQPVNSSCDAVEHGEFVYRNCSYCRCVDGVFECRRHELEGCGKEPKKPKRHSYHDDDLALDTEPRSHGCVPRGSLLGPVMAAVVVIHRMLWLQSTPVR